MSGTAYITHNELTSALERLSKEMDVWIPVETGDKKWGIQFSKYQPGKAPLLERQSTTLPKKVLFPQVETLLRFCYQKDVEDRSRVTIDLKDLEDMAPAMVFGARPCDVRGFLTFDQVFLNGLHKDPYYAQRREKTLFATLVCETPDSACFCSSVGSGPADQAGSDLWIIPIEGGYLIESLNERGEKLLPKMGKEATQDQIESAQRFQEKAANERVGEGDLTRYVRAFEERFSDKAYWRDMVSKCISCGICTYVCPTCYCFTITDEMKELEGERLRSWDSCMFHQYTQEASGHNPRPTKFERYRNRVGHKFSYFPDKYNGMISCCGCGRCIRSCPVSVDIRQIVRQLKEEAGDCVST
ncbi:MAG: 4Fe-4S dicluster domain-containing protein [Desulfosarcina sp.]|nr:4Fe-4S dicluster domain-containing protein [Desulfosarcina sp.]MBC2742322.1 4Fe-4S dicluster domain-containing protein [Desulfosarcina sp.]MBC2765233.1 hydrogenase [Desulfosarcina sp.]